MAMSERLVFRGLPMVKVTSGAADSRDSAAQPASAAVGTLYISSIT